MERLRRLSYAGVTKQAEQKSRRISDAGQSGPFAFPACMPSKSSSEAEPMLHDSRYESNLNRAQPGSRRTSRPNRGGDEAFTCSQQSVLSAMDRFVKAVNNMDSTVLVPSRLQDMEVTGIPPAHLHSSADVYKFFLMLKDAKNELLWGPPTTATAVQPSPSFSGRSTPRSLKHVRRPSDDSLGGSSGGFPSDTDSDDLESVVTDRDSIEEAPAVNHLATSFRHHLLGLHTILHELADSADFLSNRYQEEIEAP